MKTILSGTSLVAVEKFCLAWLDHREAGVPQDTRIFEPGTAAHDFLEAAHKMARAGESLDDARIAALSEAVILRLTTEARADRAPLGITRAMEGVALGARYLARHPEFDPDALPEIDMAVDAAWLPLQSGDPATAFRGRLDQLIPPRMEPIGEDGEEYSVLTVLDYKTAWPTSASELDSWQFRLYCLLALAHYPGADALRRTVVNLRTGGEYTDLLWLDDEGAAKIQGWREDIGRIVSVANAARTPTGERMASPGAHCAGCHYLSSCKHARAAMAANGTPEEQAAAFAVSVATRELLAATLKPICAEQHIPVPGGFVGYYVKSQNEVVDDAPTRLLAILRGTPEAHTDADWRAQNAAEIAILDSLSLGVGNIREALTRAFPGRDSKSTRLAYEAELLRPVQVVEFGVSDTAGLPATKPAKPKKEAK